MSEALFDMEPETAGRVVDPTLSPDRRRTANQQRLLAFGKHPSGRRLHPDAPRVTGPGEPGEGPRCGDCVHLFHDLHHNRTYLKCEEVGVTNGAGTDMRRWWPACTAWEAKP